MTQTIEKYLEIGQPILVVSENNWLVPYELQKTNLIGKSSGITHRTPQLFRDCLERITCKPFNSTEFDKITREGIFHLDLHLDFDEKVYAIPDEKFYLYKRLASEVACEMTGEKFPLKKISELPPEELDAEIKNMPKRNIDLAWQTIHSIQLAAQSDAIGERQRRCENDWSVVTLYEIKFSPEKVNPAIDIYLQKRK